MLVARREVQELRWHQEFACLIQIRTRYVEKLRRAYEVGCAERDQLVDVPWREFSRLVIGKRTWRAIVSYVAEFSSDEPCPLRSLAKGEAGAPSRSPNEIAHMYFR